MRKFRDFIMEDAKGIPANITVNYDQKVFQQMVEFITTLDPEQLSQEQNGRIVDLIVKFDMSLKGKGKEKEIEPSTEMIKEHKGKMKRYYAKYKAIFDQSLEASKGNEETIV